MNRYEQLRSKVVEALDAEIGDDVVAIREILLEAITDPTPTVNADAAVVRQAFQRLLFYNPREKSCVDAANEAVDRLVVMLDQTEAAMKERAAEALREWLRANRHQRA